MGLSLKRDLKMYEFSSTIIGLAFALSVGILLNILACALWNNWWPIFVVIAYIMAPFPNIMCANCGKGYEESQERAFIDAGNFFTGMIIVSGLALPTLLMHVGIIRYEALFMALAGGVVTYGTILIYLHVFHRENEDFDMY